MSDKRKVHGSRYKVYGTTDKPKSSKVETWKAKIRREWKKSEKLLHIVDNKLP
jgi:hypothetical protein